MRSRLKAIAKTLLNSSVDALPWGARASIMWHQVERFGELDIMRDLARRSEIAAFVAAGDQGTVEGDIFDFGVLCRYARERRWARQTVAMFEDLFASDGGTFIDIGANIGLITIPIARNRHVTCYAFEPEPSNYLHLLRNVATNCAHRNVTTYNLALFDRQTTLDFELSRVNGGDHRIRCGPGVDGQLEEARTVISVTAARLDDALPTVGSGRLAIKIDTQGAEPFVVGGGRETIERADVLVAEYWPYGIRRLGGTPDGMIDLWSHSFTEGAVMKGEAQGQPDWAPVAQVCDGLLDLWGQTSSTAYYDVYLRRT